MPEPLRSYGSEPLLIIQMKMKLMEEGMSSDDAEKKALDDLQSGRFLQDPYTELDTPESEE